jgi:CheY-like chemotaxis protein
MFRVSIPRAPESVALPEPDQRDLPHATSYSPLVGLHVVVIDNEPTILDGMQRLLTGWGCQVLTAGHAAEAMEKAGQAKVIPAIALVDYQLDDGHGLDAIRRLRWRYGSDLPAVLITADRSPEVREEAASENVQILNKPIRPPSLRALLAQLTLQSPRAAE